MRDAGANLRTQSGVGKYGSATGGSAVPLVRRTYDRSGHRNGELTALSGQGKGSVAWSAQGLASGAAKTSRQADGNCASVTGGFSFGGTFGGLG